MKKAIKIFLSVLTLMVVFALAACGKEDSKDDAKDSADKKDKVTSYTVEHAMGSTQIEGTPKRIVVLTNEGTEALIALGITPVGAVQSWLGDPWYDHIKNEMGGVSVVGTESEVNLEKIAELKPDLIIGNKVRQEAVYDKLSAIAPTIFAETLKGEWQDNFKLYAEAANLEEKGAEALATYDKKVADLKVELGDKTENTVSVVRFLAGTTRLYYTDSFSGVILNQLGFKRAAKQEELFTDDNKLMIEVGKEAIPDLDADYIFYFTYAPAGDKDASATEQEWTTDALWKNLSAVKNGQAFKVEDAVWNTAGGIMAANLVLDEIKDFFIK